MGEAKEATTSSVQEAYIWQPCSEGRGQIPLYWGGKQQPSFSQTRGHSPPWPPPACRETLHCYLYNGVLLIESLYKKPLSPP